MRQSILRKTRYLLVAVMAFVLSFTAIFVSMPSAKAADEILLAQLTLSDVIANTSTPLGPSDKIQGTKGIFEWKGIKTVNTDSIVVHGNGDNFSYFWIGGDTGDYTMQVSKFVCTFTVSDKAGTFQFIFSNTTKLPSMSNGYNEFIYEGDELKKHSSLTDFKLSIDLGGEATISTLDIKIYYKEGQQVNITAGTGIKSAYLSTTSKATSGSASGSNFDEGATVYGFVKLKAGYKVTDQNWTLISSTEDIEDAIYCVGSETVGSETVNFGTFNATPKSLIVTPKGNGVADLADVTLTYDQAATINAPTDTRFGCEFSCWNTRADGNGYDYGTDLSEYDVNDLILSDTTLLYAKWVYDQTIQDLIDEIGGITVEYTGACKAAINTALSHYEALSDDYKAVFPETSYNLLISKSNAYDAMDKINAIGTIANTPESKALVDAAKNFYDGLDSDTQALVLSDFVTTLNDAVAVMNAITKVNEIGDLDEGDECRTKIDAAISAYSNLTTDQTNMFPTDTYNTLNDKDSAKTVIDKIKAIGNVEYSSESKGKIDNAQTAFNGLTEGQKALVSNYGKLVQANTDYDKVDEAVTKINSLPVFEYSDEYKEELDAVKGVYDALTDYQKSILPQDSLTKLNEALNEYEAIDSIFNIGTIENTTESKNRVKRAKDAYDNLTESQKATIPTDKVDYLLNAIVDFEVIDKINSVKNAGYSSKDKENIDSARTAYNALTTEQKEMFPASALALLSNIETAYPVMISINQLGKVEYTSDYKNELDTIKAIYDSLTDSQKALVRNYVVLAVDEQSYTRVDDAYKAIEAIDKVKYNSSSRIAIEDARKCYNKLSNDERLLIKDEEEKLIKAEKKYEKAEHNHNVGMAWVTAICIIFGVVIVTTGLWLLIIFILKRRKDNDKKEEKNNKKSKK